MNNVTEINRFRPKRMEEVFECSCESQHFYLNADGTIECRSCKQIQERIEWIHRDAPTPQQAG